MSCIVGPGIAVMLASPNCGVVGHDRYLNCDGWLLIAWFIILHIYRDM